MLQAERQTALLNVIQTQKVVSISKLSQMFDVSSNTIRRDLMALEKGGLLKKTRGGAMALQTAEFRDLPFLARQAEYQDEKRRIGKLAFELINDGQVIFLDAGTTTLEIARRIRDQQGFTNLTVVTTSIDIASELTPVPGVSTFVTGGMVSDKTRALVGPHVEEALADIHIDIAFLSTAGISLRGGLTSSNVFEVGVKKAAIRSAGKVVAVAARHRLGSVAMVSFASLDQIDAIITDRDADPDMIERLKKEGVTVYLA